MILKNELFFVIMVLVAVQGLLKKQKLAFIIDTSKEMGNENFHIAKQFINNFQQHFSISQGTTRAALFTINQGLHRHLDHKMHVNRELFLETLKGIRCCFAGQLKIKSLLDSVRILNKKGRKEKAKILLFIEQQNLLALQAKFGDLSTENAVILVVGSSNEKSEEICRQFSTTCINLPSEQAIEEVKMKIGISDVDFTKCSGTGKVFDECERHCDCVNGTLTNCYRVRKEFMRMSIEERQRYLRAYFHLTTNKKWKAVYEKYVFIHYKYFCWGIHRKDLFCPWHRFYILQMENLLREIDCRITLPYWDWSLVGNDPWNRTGIWRKTDDGLGGNGMKSHGFCVRSGLFREGNWLTPFFNDALDIIDSTMDLFEKMKSNSVIPDLSDCLRRYFYGKLPDQDYVKRSLEIRPENFEDFDINLRINYHDKVHNGIGGTMCTHFAATAPEFFLHHSFLDKIWFSWQQKSFQHQTAHFQNSAKKLAGFPYTAKQLIDSHNLPGSIKVTYTRFPWKEIVKRDADTLPDYADDNNAPGRISFKNILKTVEKRTFPSCDRSEKERLRAKELFRRFSNQVYFEFPFELIYDELEE